MYNSNDGVQWYSEVSAEARNGLLETLKDINEADFIKLCYRITGHNYRKLSKQLKRNLKAMQSPALETFKQLKSQKKCNQHTK